MRDSKVSEIDRKENESLLMKENERKIKELERRNQKIKKVREMKLK